MAPTTKSNSNNNAFKSSSSSSPGQKSLTSFFGAAKSKKTGEIVSARKVQIGIKAAFKPQQAGAQSDATTPKEKSECKISNDKDMENVSNVGENNDDDKDVVGGGRGNNVDLMDTDDDEDHENPKMTAAAAAAAKKDIVATAATAADDVKSRRKRIIDDDSENEEAANDDGDVASDDELDEDYNDNNVNNLNDGTTSNEDENLDLPSDDDGDEANNAGEQKKERVSKVHKSSSHKLGIASSSKQVKKLKTLPAADTDANGTSSNVVLLPPSSPADAPAKSSLKSKYSSSSSSSNSNSASGGTATTTSTTNIKKSEAAAKAMKSNSQLLAIMSEEVDSYDSNKIWNLDGGGSDKLQQQQQKRQFLTTSTPYSALCDVFTEIESVSGRLDIQEKLTTLFRKVLLKDGGGRGSDDGDNFGIAERKEDEKETKANAKVPATASKATTTDNPNQSDLYTLLYLASNTVAPQHENVELGVGDGILIKAIGEASGTAPNMIKKKYEKEGDLGNVAMNAKGKQRTLVGFGKATGAGGGGPKRLSCVDVLKVFKEIVSCNGDITWTTGQFHFLRTCCISANNIATPSTTPFF